MASYLVLILGMSASVFALRIGGLALRDIRLPATLERATIYLPVALLAALVAASLAGRGGRGEAWYIAALGAGLIAYFTRRMWACILSGMTLYWLLHFGLGI